MHARRFDQRVETVLLIRRALTDSGSQASGIQLVDNQVQHRDRVAIVGSNQLLLVETFLGTILSIEQIGAALTDIPLDCVSVFRANTQSHSDNTVATECGEALARVRARRSHYSIHEGIVGILTNSRGQANVVSRIHHHSVFLGVLTFVRICARHRVDRGTFRGDRKRVVGTQVVAPNVSVST